MNYSDRPCQWHDPRLSNRISSGGGVSGWDQLTISPFLMPRHKVVKVWNQQLGNRSSIPLSLSLSHTYNMQSQLFFFFFFCFHAFAYWHRLATGCVTGWSGTPAEEFSWFMYRKRSDHSSLGNIWEGPQTVHLIHDAFKCSRNVTLPYDFLNIRTAGAPCFPCARSCVLIREDCATYNRLQIT